MRFPPMSLQQRLARHVGRLISLEAKSFTSEIGKLQKVCPKNWIKVSGVFFVSLSLNQIVLHRLRLRVRGPRIFVRTVFRPGFTAELVRLGTDFIEVVERDFSKGRGHILIPLNKVISIEEVWHLRSPCIEFSDMSKRRKEYIDCMF